MKKEHTEQEKKSLFPWLIAAITIIFFGIFFVNGYLIFKETGIDDEDVVIFE